MCVCMHIVDTIVKICSAYIILIGSQSPVHTWICVRVYLLIFYGKFSIKIDLRMAKENDFTNQIENKGKTTTNQQTNKQ